MRFIDRNNPPPSLAEWKSLETCDQQCHYDGSLPTVVKDSIRDHRARDQGYLCAYTMKRIKEIKLKDGTTQLDAHVEHVITRKSSKERDALDETVDYGNLVACVDRGATLSYGASARGDTAELLPVHPFQATCANRFNFHSDGSVTGRDSDADATIKKLKLDHDFLKNDRWNVLRGLGIGKPRVPTPDVRRPPRHKVSAPEARRRAIEALQFATNGTLPEFCVALAQVYEKHAELIEKRRRHLRFTRSPSK